MDFLTPDVFALFSAFSIGATKFVRDYFKLSGHVTIRAISIVAFVIGVYLHYLLPGIFQIILDVLVGGIGVTGGFGALTDLANKAGGRVKVKA